MMCLYILTRQTAKQKIIADTRFLFTFALSECDIAFPLSTDTLVSKNVL